MKREEEVTRSRVTSIFEHDYAVLVQVGTSKETGRDLSVPHLRLKFFAGGCKTMKYIEIRPDISKKLGALSAIGVVAFAPLFGAAQSAQAAPPDQAPAWGLR